MNQISIVAQTTNTIPLDFEFDAKALNADGNLASVSLICNQPNNTLKGSTDGIKEEYSTLRLTLKLDKNGDIGQLAEIDAIDLKFKAKRSHPGTVALNSEQYISLKLKLEIDGQINVDLGNLQ